MAASTRWSRATSRSAAGLTAAIIVGVALAGSKGPGLLAQGTVAAAVGAEPSGESFTFTVANRPIVVLRARVLGRSPIERASGAGRILDNLVAQRITGPVESRSIDGGSLITVASRVVLGLTPPDIDELSGETMPEVMALTVAWLQRALDEAVEARRAGAILTAAALA